ncbi:MAG: ClcB-like voltage-gated chloride channel protein [Verrucomicrobiota bacterium]|nr:ClcB-like voltage-gated chloride channel protein [Verrucomicrobiota bacterium]
MNELKPGPDSMGAKHFRLVVFWLRILARWRPGSRQILLLMALAVGVLGALAALTFKYATLGIQLLLTGHGEGYVETFQQLAWWQRLLVPAVGGLLAGAVLHFGQRIEQRKATDYMEAVALGDGDVPLRPSLIRSVAALFSIASGAAIGKEGPLVQLAAVGASVLGRLRHEPPARLRLLVACGAAAGIAAAYNAPIAGALFVAEIILGSIAMESLGPLLLSSMAATLTIRSLDSPSVLYQLAVDQSVPAGNISLFLLLGVFCGLVAPLFIGFLKQSKRLFAQIAGPASLRLAAGGLIFGILAIYHPEVAGNGQSVIRSILDHEFAWQLVALIMVMKVLAVAAVFGSGAVGGVFTPSLLVGASLGYLAAVLATALGVNGVVPEFYVVVGMGAFLGAAAQAPIMALLLMFEMTLCPAIILPMMAASVSAYFVARSVSSESLYGESLRAGPRSVFDKAFGTITVRNILRPSFAKTTASSAFGEIAARFLRASEGVLPVTDGKGIYLGAVLLDDVRPYLKEADLARSVIAHDIMRDDLPTLSADFDLPEALRTFGQTNYETLPVVDTVNGQIIGLLARADLFLVVSELTRRDGVKAT